MVVAMEGGYELQAIGRSAASQLAFLSGNPEPAWDEKPRGDEDVRALVKESRKALEPWWTF
jgi:acetoin utilization deacetylase AcuC-like enzyme